MSSGVSRVFTGSFVGTGAIFTEARVGFTPRKVEIFNTSGVATLVFVDTMAADSGVKTITAGTVSVITSGGITVNGSGFLLGADTDVNVSGEVCHFVAYE